MKADSPRSLYLRLFLLFAATLIGSHLAILLTSGRALGKFMLSMREVGLTREAWMAARIASQAEREDWTQARLEDEFKRVFAPIPNLSVALFDRQGKVHLALRPPDWARHDPEGLKQRLQGLAAKKEAFVPLKLHTPFFGVAEVEGSPEPLFAVTTIQRRGGSLLWERAPQVWLWPPLLVLGISLGMAGVALAWITRRTRAVQSSLEAEVARDQEARRQLLADLSHELKTPLTSLQGQLEMLSEFSDEIPELARENLEALKGELEVLKGRVEDLRLVSAEALPELSIEVEGFSLGPFLEAFHQRQAPLFSRRGLDFQLELRDPEVFLESDPQRLGQILEKLSENALGVLSAGEGVCLSLESSSEGSLQIWFEDDGPGLEEGLSERVFERFQKGEKHVGGGTGLGLAIAKSLAEALGGELRLEPSRRGGASFLLVLPRPESRPPSG